MTHAYTELNFGWELEARLASTNNYSGLALGEKKIANR